MTRNFLNKTKSVINLNIEEIGPEMEPWGTTEITSNKLL